MAAAPVLYRARLFAHFMVNNSLPHQAGHPATAAIRMSGTERPSGGAARDDFQSRGLMDGLRIGRLGPWQPAARRQAARRLWWQRALRYARSAGIQSETRA